MVILRSQTKRARNAVSTRAASAKRKHGVLRCMREFAQRVGKQSAFFNRAEAAANAFRRYKASIVCGGCQAKTDMMAANVCSACTEQRIDRCFGCLTRLVPATRTWMVQTRDYGEWYADRDYEISVTVPGNAENGWNETYSGPTRFNEGEFQGPIPMVEFAYYCLDKGVNPWCEASRRRAGNAGDCTTWKRCGGYGSVEEMRRLPYCVHCAIQLPRDHVGAPVYVWNKCDDADKITEASQLHCC